MKIGFTGTRRELTKGHPYTEENTYLTRTGFRKCRKCRNANALARYHALRIAEKSNAIEEGKNAQ